MDAEYALDIAPWLKTDLLSGFGDLLESEPALRIHDTSGDFKPPAATLGSIDLLGFPQTSQASDLTADQQTSHADWLKSMMAGVPSEAAQSLVGCSEGQPFAGFPAAGILSALPPISLPQATSALPLAHGRTHLDAPSSWESSLSSYSLESSLNELASVPERVVKCKLRSENSLAGSDLDSMQGSLCPEQRCEDVSASKGSREHGAKASLADRNRERQQRFRQRQKQKIETLEAQVAKLTAQTRLLAAEKEDMTGRANKFKDLLQARDQQLVNATSQVVQLRNGTGAECDEQPQLTLTYCNPPMVLTTGQLKNMTGQDLAKLWKEYAWQLSQLLPKDERCSGQWTSTSERLDALTSELVQLMMHLWDSCAEYLRFQANGMVEEGHKPDEQQGYERWRSVADSLALTTDQVASVIALRKSLRMRLRQIWSQRREMHTGMLTCLEEELLSGREVAMQHMKVKQSVMTMEEGLKQESMLVRDFEFSLLAKVLRPQQRAECLVRSYPYYPDCQALANWIAAEGGDADAHSMLHSTSSTTSYHSNS